MNKLLTIITIFDFFDFFHEVGSVTEVLDDGIVRVQFKKKKRPSDVHFEQLIRVVDSNQIIK